MARHLVVQLARFGDLIQTKRLILSLAAEDSASVHLAVDDSLAALARATYPFAVVHALPAHAGGRAPADVLRLARGAFAALRGLDFASVYMPNFSGLAFALAALFPPERVRGYKNSGGRRLRPRWCRMAFRWAEERRIAPLNLMDYWGLLHPRPIAPALVNPKARPGGFGRVAVALAGRQARRSLPPAVMAVLLEAVFAELGGPQLLLLGSKAERPLARQVIRLLRPAVLQKTRDYSGDTGLHDLPELLAGCDCILTPDTGVMHLAAHLGVPVRAFFLSSAWCFETGPYGDGHRIWQATQDCAPCVETHPCPCDAACLAPFAQRNLWTAASVPAEYPANLVELASGFDPLGVRYAPVRGALPEYGRHIALRAALAQHVGTAFPETPPDWAVERLTREHDWMLPDC